MKWYRNYKADIETNEYMVVGYRLYDDEYYGPDGMWDNKSSIAEDKYRLEIYSWRPDFYNRHVRVADHCSDVKLKVEFNSKDEANAVWLHIKRNKPSIEQLIASKMFSELI